MKPKIPYNNPYVTKRNTAGTALSAEASGLNVPKNINKSHVSQKTKVSFKFLFRIYKSDVPAL